MSNLKKIISLIAILFIVFVSFQLGRIIGRNETACRQCVSGENGSWAITKSGFVPVPFKVTKKKSALCNR